MKCHQSADWLNLIREQPARKPALITANGALTYGELAARSSAVRTLFFQRGLRAGQHVLLAVRDERQFMCLLLGACSAGLSVMVADPELPSAAANEITQRYEPDDIVLEEDIADRWKLPAKVWSIKAEPKSQQGALFGRLLGRSSATGGLFSILDEVVNIEAAASLIADNTALIFFTSGTTSLPKAVEISHASLCAHLSTLARQHGYEASSHLLNPLPWHHADGLVQGPLVTIFVGATVYRTLAFTALNVPRFLDLIYSDKITHLVAVPTILAMILRLGAHQFDSFSSAEFRHVISTAGYLDEALWCRFEDVFNVQVTNTYGLTETVAGGIFSGPGVDTRKVGSLGKPVDCEVRIVTDSGTEVAQGETGELLMRGTNLMRGYYRDTEVTALVLRDGWLHTGDLVWSDADGFIHFAGRVKNVIVCGGNNIQPEEVNDVIKRHASVQAVATVGLPHPEWEAIAVSAVVPLAGVSLTEADLIAHCRLFLPAYKLPRRIVFLGALPYGPSGKVRNDLLRELCEINTSVIHANENFAERVMELAKQIFNAHPGGLGEYSGPDNTMGWDSLAHIEFVTALEKQFAITLNDRDIVAITHLGAAIEVVGRVLSRG